jgi:two-component system C4-dicarboxylate transport sensor histidine kinase DctB
MIMPAKVKLAALLLAAAVVIAGAGLLGGRFAAGVAHDAGLRQMQIITLDLESILERYETLPFALSFQQEAAQALDSPQSSATISQLNATLKAVQQQAKVAAVYLMDTKGLTIAASNWDNEQNYIGRNFGFRPYFLEALQGGAGRFYGIGRTTAEPGYFIAQPVYREAPGKVRGAPIGVMAVKIRLDDFARAWSGIVEPVALVDRFGVVFLSNRPDWQYRSLSALTPTAQREINQTLQYMKRDIALLDGHNLDGEPVVHAVGRLGWQLMMFPNQRIILRSALLWALAATLVVAISAISLLALYQRRRRLEERGIARAALQQASDDLEKKIILRTAELTAANRSIESKYVKLKEAEHLLRNTQNELVQASKLTMLGQMAAGVTHELSQPLTAIRAFSDNAKTFLARGQTERAEENLGLISAASERMGAIIGQLKGFARKSDAQLAAVDLAASIASAIRLLENDVNLAGCEIVVTIAEAMQVSGDAMRIEQVLINLIRNGIEAAASSERKKVWLTLSREQNGNGDAACALIRIRDSGAGMSDEVAAKLFEPFFTTKGAGQGMGLGLAISSSIVQAMNGQLSANNHVDGGAEFSLRLSLSTAESNGRAG